MKISIELTEDKLVCYYRVGEAELTLEDKPNLEGALMFGNGLRAVSGFMEESLKAKKP